MKNLMQLPAILLPLSIIAMHICVGRSMVDIHINDTLFVMPFLYYLFPVYLVIFLTWVFHVLLCRKKLLPAALAWWQVGVTMLPIMLFYILQIIGFQNPNRSGVYSVYDSFTSFQRSQYIGLAFIVAFIIATLAQVAFWIYAVVKLSSGSMLFKKHR